MLRILFGSPAAPIAFGSVGKSIAAVLIPAISSSEWVKGLVAKFRLTKLSTRKYLCVAHGVRGNVQYAVCEKMLDLAKRCKSSNFGRF